MKRQYLSVMLGALFVPLLLLPAAGQASIFISEYVEGSSNSKAIEIYNSGNSGVDLSTYKLQFFFNGSTAAGLTIPLNGVLAPGNVYVVAQSTADPALTSVANLLNSSSWYNGDDAVALVNGSAMVDVVGQIGVDPGTEWGTGLTSTADNTLRRKSSICVGDADGINAFDPAVEWDGYALNTFDGIGNHTSTCSSGGSGGGSTGGGSVSTTGFIHDVQGSGSASPLINQTITLEAVVVGDFQAANQLNGFYMQEEDAQADADPLTSEGIFVYTGSAGTDVNVGDLVRVTGTVTEYYGLTELNNVSVTVISTGNPLPTAATVQLPFTASDEMERYEGMRVLLPQTLTVTDNYNLGRYDEVWFSSGGRLMTPTNIALPGADANSVQAQNDLNRILIDDSSSIQNPDPIVYPAPALSASNTLRVGDTATNMIGVMDYAYDYYRIRPTQAPIFIAANARSAAPAYMGGTLKVASFNVLNYFNGDGMGGGFPTSRGADTYEEFQRQRTKIISAISAMNADIIGLMEIENDGYGSLSAIQDLVNGLNNVAPAGSSYAFINPGVGKIGTDEIAVGVIYRKETVTPTGVAALLTSAVDPRFDDTKNRPTLAQSFIQTANGGKLTVAVNHLKSKGSSCDDVNDPDTGDGQGNCNITRTNAALALVDWLATDPTASKDPDFMIIGDLNSYAKEDPIAAIKNGGYVDLIDAQIGADKAYSYVYNGQSGYLDHALANQAISSQISGVNEWHINADEPRVLDYNEEYKTANQISSLYSADAYRSSDHDAAVIELSLTPGSINSHVSDLDGSIVRQRASRTATVTAEVKDNLGLPVSGASVSGMWTGQNVSSAATCTTGADGRCAVSMNVAYGTSAVTFSVTNVQNATLAYQSAANSDMDGDSNGSSITLQTLVGAMKGL